MGKVVISLLLFSILLVGVSGCVSSKVRSPASPSVTGESSAKAPEAQKRSDPRSKSLFQQVPAPSAVPSQTPTVRTAGWEMKAMKAKGPIVVIYPAE